MEVDIKNSFTPKARRDYSLIRQAIESGNQQAYTELMENYRDSLYMLMFKMVNNPYDAEDLTIEAFGKAFHHLPQYTSDYAFSTWLFKIACNNCIDFMKKRRLNLFEIDRKYISDENDVFLFELNDDKPNPEECLFIKEKATEIRKLVNTLKPRYRKLIELRYFEELSYAEISAQLEIPLGTVKGMLSRAKYMLQAIIKMENGRNE
jgi:RNA polymerase sigma-70 factor (ECF subfamily)